MYTKFIEENKESEKNKMKVFCIFLIEDDGDGYNVFTLERIYKEKEDAIDFCKRNTKGIEMTSFFHKGMSKELPYLLCSRNDMPSLYEGSGYIIEEMEVL